MAKSRRSMKRRGSRKAHRKTHRKGSRKTTRRMRGGEAPVNYANPGPMNLSLAQGQQFAKFHEGQHGGAGAYAYGPYPGAVSEASVLPADLVASAKLLPLNESFDYIRQFGPSSDNPNLSGGRRRKARKSRKARKAHRKGSGKTHRKGSRKAHRKGSRKTHRKQRGGLYRWGGGGRRMAGGAYAEMRFPMPVKDETTMLIPSELQQQAGLNPEWKLAENPLSFAPNMS
jgi:hypothetical protein